MSPLPTDPGGSGAPLPLPPPPPRSRLRWLITVPWLLFSLLLGPLILPLLLAVGITALLSSNDGLQITVRALQAGLPGLEITGAQGRLIGPLSIEHLSFTHADQTQHIEGLKLDWQPGQLLFGTLAIDRLHIDRLRIQPGTSTEPTRLPNDLQLPITLQIAALELGRLELTPPGQPTVAATDDGPALIEALSARLSSDGRQHRLEHLQARILQIELNGTAQLDGRAPFPLSADARLQANELPNAPPLHIAAQAQGTLERIALKLDGQPQPTAHTGKFSLQAAATLMPFATQPLQHLQLSARALDPARFITTRPGQPAPLPHALLDLDAELQPSTPPHQSHQPHPPNLPPATAFNGRLTLTNHAAAPLDRGGLPLDSLRGQLHINLDATQPRLQLTGIQLATASGHIQGSADLVWPRNTSPLPHGQARLQLKGIQPARLHTALPGNPLDGGLDFQGDAQHQTARLQLRDGQRELTARLSQAAGQLDVEQLTLRQHQAQLTAQGQLQLSAPQRWQFTGTAHDFDPVSFFAPAAAWPAALFNARFTTRGQRQPHLTGQLQLTLDDSRIAGQSLQGHSTLEFTGLDAPDLLNTLLTNRGQSRIAGQLSLTLADSQLQLDGGWGQPGDHLQLSLDAPQLARHRSLWPQLDGALKLKAQLFANTPATQLELTAQAQHLKLPGTRPLQIGDLRLQLKLAERNIDLSLAAHELIRGQVDADTAPQRLARLSAEVHGALSQGSHQLQLTAATPDGHELKLAAAGRLQNLTPATWRQTVWQGQLEQLALNGNWPLRLTTPTELSLAAERIHLASANFSFAGGHLELSRSHWTPADWQSQGRFSDIAMPHEATVPALAISPTAPSSQNSSPPLGQGEWQLAGAADGSLNGKISARLPDLRGLSSLLATLDVPLTTAGAAELEARLDGTLSAPRIQGALRANRLAIGLPEHNVELQDGTLALRFDGQRAVLERCEFSAPHRPPEAALRATGYPRPTQAGRLELKGELDLQTATRRAWLEAHASTLPLSQLDERWLIASGKARLELNGEQLKLAAQLKADAGFIGGAPTSRPRLADDVVVLGRQTPPPAAASPRLNADIQLDLGERFQLRAAGLTARLVGQVQLRGNPAPAKGEPPLAAHGSIATRDARYEAYGQQLSVERGIVNFQGRLEDPGLNVLAVRKGGAVEAGVAISGTAQRPIVRLVSTPAVSEAEKLSWIVLGRPPEAGGVDASLLIGAAGALLGGNGESLSSQIAHTLGIDEISLRQANTQSTPESKESKESFNNQVLTLGKRLSSRIYLAYEQGLTAAAGALKLTYRLNRRLSLVTYAGNDNAIDLFYNVTFR
jgi:translocation and assembly module TamB